MSWKRPLKVYAGLAAAVALVAGAVLATADLTETPGLRVLADTGPEQPVAFSHAHHAGELGIDCRYCHAGAESEAHAGFPPMTTCAGCHYPSEDRPLVEPLVWQRVASVPDHTYFHHGIHVANDIACAECHGPVETMERLRPVREFTMRWCLDCHRDPPEGARPARDITHCHACHR